MTTPTNPPKTKTFAALTERQLAGLGRAHMAAEQSLADFQVAQARAAEKKAEAQRAVAARQDMLALVLETAGAPDTAEVNLETGTIEVPVTSPGDADENGVSKAAEVPKSRRKAKADAPVATVPPTA
jgi:uncharacterized protein YqfA (UPF0365 family)